MDEIDWEMLLSGAEMGATASLLATPKKINGNPQRRTIMRRILTPVIWGLFWYAVLMGVVHFSDAGVRAEAERCNREAMTLFGKSLDPPNPPKTDANGAKIGFDEDVLTYIDHPTNKKLLEESRTYRSKSKALHRIADFSDYAPFILAALVGFFVIRCALATPAQMPEQSDRFEMEGGQGDRVGRQSPRPPDPRRGESS